MELTLDIVLHTAAFVRQIIVNISNSLLVAVFLQTDLHLYFWQLHQKVIFLFTQDVVIPI